LVKTRSQAIGTADLSRVGDFRAPLRILAKHALFTLCLAAVPTSVSADSGDDNKALIESGIAASNFGFRRRNNGRRLREACAH
jgi:hypothetical protein